MAQLVLPKRRFSGIRRAVRRTTPSLYNWALGNKLMRRAFSAITGRRTIEVGDDLKERFTIIYNSHFWADDESRSGGGSNLYATENIRREIPKLCAYYQVRSLLDAPCGDFVWFNEMKLPLDLYIGGDIVEPLIQDVAQKYAGPGRSFRVIDITKDRLPAADLILVRDCFIHLSYESIGLALANIKNSPIQYLLTTHAPDASNQDLGDGTCRLLDLCAAPFFFPEPIEFIEDWVGGQEPHRLGLWRVADIPLIGSLLPCQTRERRLGQTASLPS